MQYVVVDGTLSFLFLEALFFAEERSFRVRLANFRGCSLVQRDREPDFVNFRDALLLAHAKQPRMAHGAQKLPQSSLM